MMGKTKGGNHKKYVGYIYHWKQYLLQTQILLPQTKTLHKACSPRKTQKREEGWKRH